MSLSATNWAWSTTLPATQKIVLLALADHANDENICWPSLSYLGDKCGLNRRTVINAINALCEENVIRRTFKDSTKSTAYQLIITGESNSPTSKQASEPRSPLPRNAGELNSPSSESRSLDKDPGSESRSLGSESGSPGSEPHSLALVNHVHPNLLIESNKNLNKEKTLVDKNEKRPRFVPPTLNDIREYCTLRRNNVDPEKFFAHYTSNGWRVGKNKMVDWQAAVRTWERANETNQRFDDRSKARRMFDKLDEIARKDVEKNGFTEFVD